MNAFDLIRNMAEIELPRPSDVRVSLAASHAWAVDPVFAPSRRRRPGASPSIDDWICRAPGAPTTRGWRQARRALVVEAAAARARGVALQRARVLSGEAGARWVARRFFGGPWPTQDLDEGVEEALTELVAQSRAVGGSVDAGPPVDRFGLLALPSGCSLISGQDADRSRARTGRVMQPRARLTATRPGSAQTPWTFAPQMILCSWIW
jgi:hypothetical protein